MSRAWLVVLAAVAVMLSGCGEDSGEVTSGGSATTTAELTATEQDLADYLVDLGASSDEATCIALALADEADTFEEANDRTADFESFGAAIGALAPDCASPELVCDPAGPPPTRPSPTR